MAQYQNGVTTSTPANPPITGNLRGICPSGWKIPSDEDFCFLTTYLDNSVDCNANGNSGNDGGGKMKSVSSYWNSPNVGATNSSAFSALPGGGYFPPSFGNKNVSAQIWTATEGIGRVLNNSSSGVYRLTYGKSFGYSVRCIKECYPTTSSAGPDQLSLSGITATLAANTPAAGETGTWTITTGSGATLSNVNSPTATFTKGTDSAYTLVWTIAGPCGTSRDTVSLRFPSPVGTTCGQAVNYAGESYPTVQIGTQCWMAKNLNVGTMKNSSAAVDSQRNNGILEKYCYNNDPANCTTFGGLYQWAEAVQYQNGASNYSSPNPTFTGNVRGICPIGWHIPSEVEWNTLEAGVGGASNAGSALKSTSNLWWSPNIGANNNSGFSALPGGLRSNDGSFYFSGIHALFWSSTQSSAIEVYLRNLTYDQYLSARNRNPKDLGFSIRCLKD
jgi:uncharacterized protein (TIGR02145 family)